MGTFGQQRNYWHFVGKSYVLIIVGICFGILLFFLGGGTVLGTKLDCFGKEWDSLGHLENIRKHPGERQEVIFRCNPTYLENHKKCLSPKLSGSKSFEHAYEYLNMYTYVCMYVAMYTCIMLLGLLCRVSLAYRELLNCEAEKLWSCQNHPAGEHQDSEAAHLGWCLLLCITRQHCAPSYHTVGSKKDCL